MPRLVKRVVIATCVTTVLAGCTSDASPPTGGSADSSPLATGSSTPTPPPVDYAKWKAGRSTPVADPIYPKRGNPKLDVLHYGLELSWQPKPKTLTGTATLRIRPTKNAKKLSLDFMPYKLDGVTIDGLEATATVAKQKLTVPAKLTKNQPVTLEVRYHGKPRPVPMPSEREDTEALGLTITRDGGLWTMQEPFGAFTWYPANDQPSDEAMYDIAVTVPAGWSAIASGTPAGKRGSTFRYRSADPVASYLTTLAVGKYKKMTAKGPHDLPLTYWYRPGVDESYKASMRKSPELLTWLEKRFGRYPFASGGIVLVDSKSGMETQQMITFGSKGGTLSEEERTLFERNLLHEYAHQWFGNSVSPTNWEDLWLNEGWATYIQFLYQQEQEQFSDTDLEAYLRQSDAELRAELGPPGSPDASHFAEGNVYICPAAMLKELNDELGDAKFFALAKAWVQQNRNTQQDRASFIAFVNKHTGRDFTELINSWLDAETTPS